MRLLTTLLIALRALRRNKLRSTLTALGIIIGVGAVIAMVSIGNGAKAQVEAQVASLGQNVVTVFPGSFTSGGARGGWGSASTLTVEDAEAVAREVAGVVAVSPDVRDRQQVLANGLNWNTTVQGSSPEFVSIRSWTIARGANFTEGDVRSAAKVCVIGNTIAEQLYPNMDPVGQTLRIRNLPFKIVGVLGSKGFNFFGQDQDDTVVVPYTSAMKRVTRRERINSITIQAETAGAMAQIQQDVTDLLMQRRQGREQDFTVRNQLELAEAATATSRTMTALLAGIASVSLVVGGIGIMNIMLVSVTERTREIGVRLAIGARGTSIMLQFLVEAVILSVLGGALGIGVGIGSAKLVAELADWTVVVPVVWIVVSLVLSAAVGIAFGFFPAWKASMLDPIEALRFE